MSATKFVLGEDAIPTPLYRTHRLEQTIGTKARISCAVVRVLPLLRPAAAKVRRIALTFQRVACLHAEWVARQDQQPP